MLFNVIGYNNEVIGQVEASNQLEAWEEARQRYDRVLDVRPALPERLPMPEYHPGDGAEEYRRELKKRQAQIARERKEWVRAMTEGQLKEYIYKEIAGPAPKGSVNRMKLEGIVNWIEGWTAGIFGD